MDEGIIPEILYEDLGGFELLSSGAYGTVYRAHWLSRSRVVAVKKVLVLEKEAHVLNTLRHRNIIQLFGIVTKPPTYCIVTEYAEHGSLHSYLMNLDNQIGQDQIIQWAVDIASGVHYLHREAPVCVIHRDLKSKNVVISHDMMCKLCDFGTSKFLSHTTKMSVAGTYAWMSPEVIQSFPVSEAADTWSYAVVVWELLTRQVPFAGLNDFRIAWMVCEEGVRLPIPSSCPKQFATLMRDCWMHEPSQRPDFKEILTVLENIQQNSDESDRLSTFLENHVEWRQEIATEIDLLKRREKELSVKESRLKDWEAKLNRREEKLESKRLIQRQISYDVSSWTEPEVVSWLSGLDVGIETDVIDSLGQILLLNHITGRRLLMLTETDLGNLGVQSIGYRKSLIQEIQRLSLDNERLINFPPLSMERNGSQSKLKSTVQLREIRKGTMSAVNMTLLFGFYVRASPATLRESSDGSKIPSNNTFSSWKYRVFVDMDDEDCDEPHQFIANVMFVDTLPPFQVHRVTKPPYVYPRWIVFPYSAAPLIENNTVERHSTNATLVNGTAESCRPAFPQMKIIISYADCVKQPRNTNFSLEVVPENRGILIEKPVTLEVVLPPSGVGDSKFRRQSVPSRHVRQLLHSSQSSPALKGSWKEKPIGFPDAVPQLPPTPGKSKVWAEMVQGLIKSATETPQSAGLRYRKASVPTPSPTAPPATLFPRRATSDDPAATIRQRVSFSIDSSLETDDQPSWGANGDWLPESAAPLPQRQPSKRSDNESLSPVGEAPELCPQRQSSSGSEMNGDSVVEDPKFRGSSFSAAVHGGNVKWSWPDQANKPKL